VAHPHIAVCVCTYKRPDLLRRALEAICAQETAGAFTYSVVVVDNDQAESARATVEGLRAHSGVPLQYAVEPRQNIALARNKAVEHADGDFIAFLDDDELPVREWLLTLLRNCQSRGADGVVGPVKPHFDAGAPAWVVKGKFYERPTYPTGYVIDWRKGRTGNVLLKREMFAAPEDRFRPQFQVGEDQDFFRRMIEEGRVFVWCDEAVAYEVVPPARWKRSFMLRRALLRGENARLHPSFGARDVVKSVAAVLLYAVFLPFSLFLGQSVFMSYLVKLCDHLGKLLAGVGIRPVKDAYVTE
jgi:succinoglycan biosynthesis protein ExoM